MAITDLVPVPPGINQGVSNAKQATMLALLGNPREWYDQECREITSPNLARLVVARTIGRLAVRGLAPAVDSLAAVLDDIKRAEPAIHAAIGHAGMLCARNVRGSTAAISNHSWGTAIDLTLDGVLDTRGDDRVQAGLTRIAPIFNRHGWFWGAGFPTEDGMHFECGDALIRRWHQEGRFGRSNVVVPNLLSLGDRGAEVVALQWQLNEKGAQLLVDGDFGRGTHAAVMAFQAEHGLDVDGVVGPRTRAALGLA
jgi:hypothetical protein